MAPRGAVIFAVSVACFAVFATSVQAAVFSGTVSGQGLLYLGKFAFDYDASGASVGSISLQVETEQYGLKFMLFDDQDSSWPSVYGNDNCDCTCLHLAAKEVQSVTPGNAPVTEHDRIIEKLTPRYWYAALVTCDIEVEATYTLTFLQADGSQEGVDQRGLFTLYLLMFFFWGLGSLAQAWASRWLWRARTFHPIVKLFTLSMVCWFLFVQCAMIHWAVFAGDGVGVPFLNALGHIFEIFGRVSFLLLAMLIAKGWTISSTQLTERAQLLGAVALVLVMYLVLAIWDLAGRNPATTSYTYDSAPGVIICIMHVIFMGWFAMRVSQSYQEEKHTEKRKFFMFFGALYSLWFLSLPFFAVVGAAVNAPWRERTVDILVMVANCLWYGVLGFMLWPSRATTYFEIQTDQFVASTQQYEDL